MQILLTIALGAGIVYGLYLLLRHAIRHTNRCPNCDYVIANTAAVYRRQQDGLFPCPKCGTLVRVNHTPRK